MNEALFAKRIKNLRAERGLTVEKLSELCGMSPSFFKGIEGGAKRPSIANLVKLCNGLKASPCYFLSDSLDLSGEDDDRLTELDRKLKSLTPGQVELVMALVDEIQVQFEKRNI